MVESRLEGGETGCALGRRSHRFESSLRDKRVSGLPGHEWRPGVTVAVAEGDRAMSLKVKVWGVRGSIAGPSPNHISFGGNTSCVEVSAGGHRFILDAGTGVRNLGHWIFRKGPNHVTFLFSQTHWDHINGFPFFSPAFHPDYVFNMLAGHLNDQGGLQRVMAGQMSKLTFPVPLEAMRARLEFGDFKAGDNWSPVPGVVIRTAPLNHPNGATGYRIEHGGRSVCYITDTEHVPDKPDQNILGLIEGADLVVYDSTYTDEEFVGKVGWGTRHGKKASDWRRQQTYGLSRSSTTIPTTKIASWSRSRWMRARFGGARSWRARTCGWCSAEPTSAIVIFLVRIIVLSTNLRCYRMTTGVPGLSLRVN